MKRVLVVGGGKVGTYLASLLLADGHSVKVIEGRREEFPRLQQYLPAEVHIQGNGTDPSVLEAAGIRQADVVAAVSRADETNLVITRLVSSALLTAATTSACRIPAASSTLGSVPFPCMCTSAGRYCWSRGNSSLRPSITFTLCPSASRREARYVPTLPPPTTRTRFILSSSSQVSPSSALRRSMELAATVRWMISLS